MQFCKCPECEGQIPEWYQGPGTAGAEAGPVPDELTHPLQGQPCPECGALLPADPESQEAVWRVPVGGPALWGRVRQHWDQDKIHQDFIQFCAQAGCLDYAARRYRRRLQAGPDPDSRAARALEQIRDQAVASLIPTTRPVKKASSATWTIAGILAALLALLAAYLMQRLGVSLLPR